MYVSYALVHTCPSAIITSTWYWPVLCSTIVIAISIMGANEVGPEIHNVNTQILAKNASTKAVKNLKDSS